MKAALELTSANVFLSQETADDVNYVRLTNQLIPELRIFNYAEGMPFVTPRFPHVRFCIHSGLDQNEKRCQQVIVTTGLTRFKTHTYFFVDIKRASLN